MVVILVGISVIIPLIRYDVWLEEAVTSILDQQEVEVQLILVHDGINPKKSAYWIDDSRVTVVHSQERIGQAAGMNLGVSKAKFDFIARLDSDDISDPRRLISQLNLMNQIPGCVAVGSRVKRIDSQGKELSEMKYPVGDDIRKSLIFQNVVPHSSLLMKREAFNQCGGYDSSIRQMEDYEFILRLACIGPIGNSNELLTFYRVHDGQVSRGAPPNGSHIQKIMFARKNLAQLLGVSRFSFFAQAFVWRTVQYLRYFKIIKPGYERRK